MFRTASLFVSREKFPSDISIADQNKNIIYEDGKGKPKAKSSPALSRLRSKTAASFDEYGLRKKKNFNRNSVTLPAHYRVEHEYVDKMKQISSIENPFSYSEDPTLIQQRLQMLGTSDLKVSYF